MFVKKTLYEEAIDIMCAYIRLSQDCTLYEDEIIDYATIAVNRVMSILNFDEKNHLFVDGDGDEIFLDIQSNIQKEIFEEDF